MDQVFFYLGDFFQEIFDSTCFVFFWDKCLDKYCMFSHVFENEIFHILDFVLAECLLAADEHIYRFTGAAFLSLQDVLNNLGSSELDEDDLMLDMDLSDDQRHRHGNFMLRSIANVFCLNLHWTLFFDPHSLQLQKLDHCTVVPQTAFKLSTRSNEPIQVKGTGWKFTLHYLFLVAGIVFWCPELQ